MRPEGSVVAPGAGGRPQSLGDVASRYRPAVARVARYRWPLLLGAAAATSWGAQQLLEYDLVVFARLGHALVRGEIAGIYADTWVQAGPFELLASALALPMSEPSTSVLLPPRTLLHPVASGVAGLLFMAMLLATVRLARRVLRLPTSPVAELGVGALALALAVPGRAGLGGHLAQLAIPLMWVAAAVLARRGRTGAAAIVIGLSAGWEPWGLLGGPLLLLERSPARLLRAAPLVAVAALPYLPFVLSGQFALFDHVWPVMRDSLVGHVVSRESGFGWPLRLLQATAAGVAGSATVLLLRSRIEVVWLAPLVIVLVRLLLDPLYLPYYWLPVVLLTLLGVGLLHRGSAPVAAVLAVVMAYLAPFQFIESLELNESAGSLCLLSGLALATVVAVRRTPPAGPAGVTGAVPAGAAAVPAPRAPAGSVADVAAEAL